MKPIALIKTGGTIPEIKREHGDFEDWFVAGMGVDGVEQVDVYENQPLPQAESLAGIVITGSAAMVSHREDWSEKTAKWLKQAVDAGVPVLAMVAAILLAMWPDLPMPNTTKRPWQASTSSQAATNASSIRCSRLATAAASVFITARASVFRA